MPPRSSDPKGLPTTFIGFLQTRITRAGMVIKRVGGLDICLEVDRGCGRGGKGSVSDGKGDLKRLVDLYLRGTVVGDFACCVYYVRPFPAVCRARREASRYNGYIGRGRRKTDIETGRRWSVVRYPVGTQEGEGRMRTRIGEVYLGVSDDVLLVFEELLERCAEVGGRRMDSVPIEYLNRADFWVGGGGYKVLDDMGCDGGCTTYARRRFERERKTPERGKDRTASGLNDGKDP